MAFAEDRRWLGFVGAESGTKEGCIDGREGEISGGVPSKVRAGSD